MNAPPSTISTPSKTNRAQAGRVGGRDTNCLSRSRLRRAAGKAGAVSTTTAAAAAPMLRKNDTRGTLVEPRGRPPSAVASGPICSMMFMKTTLSSGPTASPISPNTPTVKACSMTSCGMLPPRLTIALHSAPCCSSTSATVLIRW